MTQLRVAIVGAGKVGRALHAAARAKGVRAKLLRARAAERSPIRAELVILAVPDDRIAAMGADVGARLGERARERAAVVHVSGALGPEALGAARAHGVAVAQMHPLLGFSGARPRLLEGATMLVAGDPLAVQRARRFARSLGMVPRSFEGLAPAAYHAAAALAANGAAALAAAACEILEKAGVPREVAPKMIGPLLASVAANVSELGLPRALSGPVRRGDAATVRAHLRALGRSEDAGWVRALYVASARAQLLLAARLGEASPDGLAAIQSALTDV